MMMEDSAEGADCSNAFNDLVQSQLMMDSQEEYQLGSPDNFQEPENHYGLSQEHPEPTKDEDRDDFNGSFRDQDFVMASVD
jgi:hypothetical protein